MRRLCDPATFILKHAENKTKAKSVQVTLFKRQGPFTENRLIYRNMYNEKRMACAIPGCALKKRNVSNIYKKKGINTNTLNKYQDSSAVNNYAGYEINSQKIKAM